MDYCLAAGDVPSAVLQWSYLGDPAAVRPGPGGVSGAVDRELARFLDQRLHSSNEVYALALPLARRLGHRRLESVDSHLDKDDFLRIAADLSRELAGTEAEAAGRSSIYQQTAERTRRAVATGSLLPLFEFMNSPAFSRADVMAQWDVFLRTRLPSGLDRARLALWDVRNLGIASHIRRVAANHAGGRLLVIVGAAHKPFLEALLAPMLDLAIVPFDEILPDAVAEAPVGLEGEWYMNTSDGHCSLYVREYGRGSPVVVLHGGWGAEHSYLLDAIEPTSTHIDSSRSAEELGVLVDRPVVHDAYARAGLLDPRTDRERTQAWRIQFASINLFHVERWRQLGGGQAFYSSEAGDAAARTMPEAWDFLPALEGHPFPVTVAMGDFDYVDLGAKQWRAAAAEIPALQLVVLEQAGHAAWIDQPEAFASALVEALQE